MYRDTYNIAVCISGQARTWKTAKDNILFYFDLENTFFKDKNVKVDFFIHTWDTNSYRDKTVPRHLSVDFKIDPEEENMIYQTFKPKKMIYEKYIPENHLHAWSGLFYSFMKSVNLKKEYEIENDFNYDLVVKTRFDLNFQQNVFGFKNDFLGSKFAINHPTPFAAYTTSFYYSKFSVEFNRNCFDDVFFYSDSVTMDTIANVYRWYKNICDKELIRYHNNIIVENAEHYLGPGTLLYQYLVNWGIHPTGYNVIHYYVVRKEAEDRGLNSITDWEEILKISKEFYGVSYGKV